MREDIKVEKQIKRLLIVLIILMGFLIVIESCRSVNAATITGEKSLAGFSLMQHQTNYTVYPEGIELLAEVMYHENWHTDKEHLAAYYTGAVVLNRVKSKDFPNTIKEVLYQKGQYSTISRFYTRQLPEECYHLACKLFKYNEVPENVIFQAMFKQGSGVYKKINTDYFCYR